MIYPYFCQQAACITWPQLPVWVPHGKSGCMNRGSTVSIKKKKQQKQKHLKTATISNQYEQKKPPVYKTSN